MSVLDLQRRAGWAVGLAALACAACLPVGGPPSGRHELATRELDGVGFIQPAPGESPALFTRRTPGVYTTPCESRSSAFVVDEALAPDAPATERPLADHVELPSTGIYPGNGLLEYALPSDARGRVYLTRQLPVPARADGTCPPGNVKLDRFDPATGARAEVAVLPDGFYGTVLLSPDRTRVVFTAVASTDGPLGTQIVVRDLDDHEQRFFALDPLFVGAALYAVDSKATLVELNADGTVTPTVTDVASIDVATSARGPLLVLSRTFDAGPAIPTLRLFDPATSSEIPLPATTARSAVQLSPSGRYVMLSEGTSNLPGAVGTAQVDYTLLDRDTGTSETRPWPSGQTLGWRPGQPARDEYWLDAGTELRRWKPGQETLVTAVPALAQSSSWFDPSGRWWFRIDPVNLEARPADAPETEAFDVNPPSAKAEIAGELPDGRLLVHVKVGPYNRFDIHLVDPLARTRKPLATGGFVITASETRALVMLEWVMSGSSGDLSLVDFETGAITRLGENVYRFTVEPVPEGKDLLAPGLLLASLGRSRIASPYDGLWVTTLP